MSSALRGLWDNTYGLLVDDGALAIGAIIALAVSWLAAHAVAPEDSAWLLVALVLVLVVANTYRAGVNARRKLRAP